MALRLKTLDLEHSAFMGRPIKLHSKKRIYKCVACGYVGHSDTEMIRCPKCESSKIKRKYSK